MPLCRIDTCIRAGQLERLKRDIKIAAYRPWNFCSLRSGAGTMPD